MKWNFSEMELSNDKLTSENQANTHQDPPRPAPPKILSHTSLTVIQGRIS